MDDGFFSSFSACSSKVKWFYDCESSNALTIAPADDDDKLEPINQNLERLQNDLFEQYNDASIAPINLNSFTIELTRSNFFATKSLMTSHGRFRAVRTISFIFILEQTLHCAAFNIK